MTYSSTSSIVINAPVKKVWDAWTVPEQLKQFFFGTNMVTTWEVGTPIFFRGEWDGKTYEDKGTVLSYEPMKSLSYSYWSSMSGTPDQPELYQIVRYDLEEVPEGTKMTISQSNVETQEKADHSAKNWEGVSVLLKKFVEGK